MLAAAGIRENEISAGGTSARGGSSTVASSHKPNSDKPPELHPVTYYLNGLPFRLPQECPPPDYHFPPYINLTPPSSATVHSQLPPQDNN
ncbi:hypothetical protein FRB95_010630 [Tulasnella sp. JGI-2019a]|nr:hypothetical protein FRB93_013054 [Tulasnella sp. JGI-2019a]KAG9039342.1 hypothetical protein FRB95_010630 [Tulasnella sp. JGI-2019a]